MFFIHIILIFNMVIIKHQGTLPVKCLGSVRFFYVLERSLLELNLTDQKYSKNRDIMKYDYNVK